MGKDRKIVNWAKLAVPSHSEPFWWCHLVVWCSQFALVVYPPPPNYHLWLVGLEFSFGSLVFTICIWSFTLPPPDQSFIVGRFGSFHLVVWCSQFALVVYPPPPPNRSFVVGRFGYFHLVVWCSQFAFGHLPLPPPPRIGSLLKLPRFDQNFLDTGLGFASQRIFLRNTNKNRSDKCRKSHFAAS